MYETLFKALESFSGCAVKAAHFVQNTSVFIKAKPGTYISQMNKLSTRLQRHSHHHSLWTVKISMMMNGNLGDLFL